MASIAKFIVAALLAVAVTAYAVHLAHSAGYEDGFREGRPTFTYPEGRAFFVTKQAAQFGKADTLVIGDSHIEQTFLDGACGKTFSAGIGGARVSEPLSIMDTLIDSLDPETVVIAIGANYFTSIDQYDQLVRDYPNLLDSAGDVRLILVGTPAFERGRDFVRTEAERRGATYVDPPDGPFIADGIHYAPEGTAALREAIEEACDRPTK